MLNFDEKLESINCDGYNPIYVGCYSDSKSDRDLPMFLGNGHDKSSCNRACKDYTYFGLQYHSECWCGHAYGTGVKHVKRPDSACGGAEGSGTSLHNSVYKTCANKGEYAYSISEL